MTALILKDIATLKKTLLLTVTIRGNCDVRYSLIPKG